MAAAFARKRGVADNYCEREKQCYGRRTHCFRLHPPGRQRGNQLLHRAAISADMNAPSARCKSRQG
jgi:hypothetical protein